MIGCFDALGAYVSTYKDETRVLEQQKALIWNLVKWNLWVVLIPPIIFLGRRFPITRVRLARHATLQLSFSISFALIHLTLLFLVYSLIIYRGARLSSVFTTRFYVFVSEFLINILIYCLVLALVHTFELYREARAGDVQAAQLEARLAQAQLRALKMQLQPHFLFNALNSISAHLRDPDTARRMMARLGDFLRLTLANEGMHEVTVKQELEFLSCYLDIERTRFRDRLQVEIDVEPETLDARVPNLILQPIVENAIKHGIAPQDRPGLIDVKVRRLNAKLQVQIRDNGIGLRDLKRQTDRGEEPGTGGGIGIGTTRARLAQLYPSAHRLQMEDAPGGGLLITMEIPFRTWNDRGIDGTIEVLPR